MENKDNIKEDTKNIDEEVTYLNRSKNIVYIPEDRKFMRLSDALNDESLTVYRDTIKMDESTEFRSFARYSFKDPDNLIGEIIEKCGEFRNELYGILKDTSISLPHSKCIDKTDEDKLDEYIKQTYKFRGKRKPYSLTVGDKFYNIWINNEEKVNFMDTMDIDLGIDMKYKNEYFHLVKCGIPNCLINLYFNYKDSILNHKGKTYRQFEIPKSNGKGMRTIKEPINKTFKEAQVILKDVMTEMFFKNTNQLRKAMWKGTRSSKNKNMRELYLGEKESNMYAYLPGRSVSKCNHKILEEMFGSENDNNGSDVLKLDLSKFFESISWEYVKNKCQMLVGIVKEDEPYYRFIKKLMLDENDRLYVGNPVSGIASDIVMMKAWSDIRFRLSYLNIRGYIYADDMIFINNEGENGTLPTKKIIGIINSCLRDNGLHDIKLNQDKIRYQKNNDRRILGINIRKDSNGEVNFGIPKKTVLRMRAMFNNYGKHKATEEDLEKLLAMFNYYESFIKISSQKITIARRIFDNLEGLKRFLRFKELEEGKNPNDIKFKKYGWNNSLFRILVTKDELENLYNEIKFNRSDMLMGYSNYISQFAGELDSTIDDLLQKEGAVEKIYEI